MKFPRRQFLHLAAGSVALPLASHIARGQAYPFRPVRLIVGFPAAGVTDITARLIGQWLSERFGQPFVVENRVGAVTNLAVEALVRAAPDGYTLLMATSTNAINASIYEKLNFNFIADTTPVAGIADTPLVMVVNPEFPAKTVLEFFAFAKANPGRINMASSGTGTPGHVAGELCKMLAGINMLHVPYRGDLPAITDLISNQVQVYFSTLPAAIEYIRTRKLRALAVTTTKRSQALPDIPTMDDMLPGFDVSIWVGLVAPKNTPDEVVRNISRAVDSALVDPKIKARFAELGLTELHGSSADFGKFIVEETAKYGKVVKFAGIKPE